ncbi:helix-turn-helix transcriptional regulator [Citrobacter freundii]|uniref:helix-turn-helix domain-containing protein n=1 Tax=Citrobacter TaxID=544 RepID=UPI0015E4E0FD|nr:MULTISPECIES: helix-turn-helix transcriptional regulator [Citrobacter]HEO8445191.1 helix-turn-helix transcriptional regulator [Yersinia enterocolitica]ELW9327631.1 helix-turn-helix transcriptional regulator [Citrobacter freundii]ELW9351830.1 helix-turn-helix transcriptional regulator [Citrobacter freundii]MCR3700795.1 helix-turn-helix domain-containing protein [Citrobacter portucalensis]QLO02492.1 helix-turn-helix transcriptional regulator [Citrobacter freundii]
MNDTKETGVVIHSNEKESVRDRVKKLFKGRSLRQVSLDWDIPYSTLNNYFSREATPSTDVLVKIAETEDVSVEWLATGRRVIFVIDEAHTSEASETPTIPKDNDHQSSSIGFTATQINDERFMELTWAMFFSSLSQDEKQELIYFFSKFGAKGILTMLRSDRDKATEWENLSQGERERLLRLHDQLKKGTPETDSGVAETDLSGDSKKAG